ncbi:hypothetical protein OSB04_019055 [Centaurea solstitialis]|uniref:Uncharacterized protein n=1 Tax=Centaurea solstitialis TaxID=347529 RepID=A0AA38W4P2_9ASTR|nr:hypothetical protein OSB04_019055 [Centaurea solstitialis]
MLPGSGIPDSRTGRSCGVQMPFRIGNHDFRIGIWPSLDEMLFVLEVEFPSLSFPHWVRIRQSVAQLGQDQNGLNLCVLDYIYVFVIHVISR